MKKIFKACVFFLIIFLALSAYASGSIPPELKTFLLHFYQEFSSAVEELSTAIQKTDQPAVMAKAITQYTDRLEPLFAKLAEYEEKYQDFFLMMEENDGQSMGDDELDRMAEGFEKFEERLTLAMMKVFPHIENPDIMAALQRLKEIMPDDDDDEDDDGDGYL